MISLGVIHTIAATTALVAGAAGARARALEGHYRGMTWSYVGLTAAAVSEISTRMPALQPRSGQRMAFGITVGVATLLVVGVGARLIRRRRSALLAPYHLTAERAVRVESQ